MHLRYRILAAALLLAPLSLAAQRAEHPGWPNVNRPVEIAPGETVHLLNRILVDRGPGLRPGRRLDYQIRTRIPPSDGAGREAQAERLVRVLGPDAVEQGVRQLAIAICDTEACATRNEPSRVWYLFERGPGGVWQRVRR